MSDNLRWEIIQHAYPQLFSSQAAPSCECGDGWLDIVEILCARLSTIAEENPGLEITLHRVKQKFGVLRVHVQVCGANPLLRLQIRDTVELACSASERCCEVCAGIGKWDIGPPNKVRCEACWEL